MPRNDSLLSPRYQTTSACCCHGRVANQLLSISAAVLLQDCGPVRRATMREISNAADLVHARSKWCTRRPLGCSMLTQERRRMSRLQQLVLIHSLSPNMCKSPFIPSRASTYRDSNLGQWHCAGSQPLQGSGGTTGPRCSILSNSQPTNQPTNQQLVSSRVSIVYLSRQNSHK